MCVRVTVLSSVLLMWAWCPCLHSADWPQFRGPNGAGVASANSDSAAQNLPIEFSPTQNVRWCTALPPGHSSPCIAGDRIFVTGYSAQEQKLETICLERLTGKVIWRQPSPAAAIEKVHRVNTPATATPAADAQHVYVYFGSFGLLCYDRDGKLIWQLPLPMPQTYFGSGTSPIVVNGRVILSRDEQKEPYLLAVDCKTGSQVWKQPLPGLLGQPPTSYSTPVVWYEQVVVHRAGEVSGYSLADGKRQWWIHLATSGTSTPVIGGVNTLYVGAWSNFGEPELRVSLPAFSTLLEKHDANSDKRLSQEEFPGDLLIARRPEVGEDVPGGQVFLKPFFDRLDTNKDGSIGSGEWLFAKVLLVGMSQDHGLTAIKSPGAGDLSATHVLWKESKNVAEVPSPLSYENRIYMVKDGGIVSCLDAMSGKLVYRQRLGGPGPYYASPIAAHGRIYAASATGTVVVFAAGDEPLVLAKNELGDPIFATPAVIDGTLYVRTAEKLYAFAAAGGE